ncbi:MAG: hypothetical protein ACRER1_04720 [Gammaproteobacteria bacterium]
MRSLHFALPALICTSALAACGAPPQHETGTAPASSMAPASAPAAATLANPKIAAGLKAMARTVRAAPTGTAAAALSTAMIRVNEQREIQIYIHVSHITPDVEQAIGAAGASNVRPSKPLGLYQAWASAVALARIANLSAVTKITPPVYGFPQSGGH